MGRQELLHDLMEHVTSEGIGAMSLRDLATVAGTSHRMLLYHFGSREGLLAAIVAENERRERATADRYRAADISPVDALRATWKRLRAPARAGEERLFFELAAMAMYGRPGTERFADDMVGQWKKLAGADAVSEAQLRLDLAVIRGLLLDLLVTGDRKGADAAFERYIARRG